MTVFEKEKLTSIFLISITYVTEPHTYRLALYFTLILHQENNMEKHSCIVNQESIQFQITHTGMLYNKYQDKM